MMLVHTPSPKPNESLMGFVLRVSDENGYDTPWHILKLAGFSQGEMKTAGFPVAKLASILGCPPEQLERIAYCHGKPRQRFKLLAHDLGSDLKNGPLRLRRPGFCPACVQELGYIEAFWDLSAALACPVHKRMALRACPSCGQPLRWFRPGLLVCECGCDLSAAGQADALPSLVELMGILRHKVLGIPLAATPGRCQLLINRLAEIPLMSLLKMLQSLGQQGLRLGGSSKGTSAEAAISESAKILSDWPRGYHLFLEGLGAHYLVQRPGAVGLRKQFEPFYEALFKQRSFAKDAQFLREEFVCFGLSQWGHAWIDPKFSGVGAGLSERRFISKTEFARKFGVWKPTLERLIASGVVVTKKVAAGKSIRTLVDLETSSTPVASSGVLSVREAAARLGIPVSVLGLLRQDGIYRTQPRLGYERSWHLDGVEAFLSSGLALVTAGTVVVSDSVELKQLMRLKFRSQSAKADIVKAVFDGRLPVVGHVGVNLGGLLLAKSEVDFFLQATRVVAAVGTYSFQEAAVQTGLDLMTIEPAVGLDLLQSVVWDGRRRISRESVELFNESYIPLKFLARQLDTLPAHLWRFLREHSISVIAVPRGNGNSAQPVLPREYESPVIALWRERRAAQLERESERLAEPRVSREEALRRYLHNVEASMAELPMRAGQPNKSAIAAACGFSREAFYDTPRLATLLAEYLEQLAAERSENMS